MLRTAILTALASSLFACAADDPGSGDSDDEWGKNDIAGNAVALFTGEHVFFDDVMNRTTVDAMVALPAQSPSSPFKKVTLVFKLSCPEVDQCDHGRELQMAADAQARHAIPDRLVTMQRLTASALAAAPVSE